MSDVDEVLITAIKWMKETDKRIKTGRNSMKTLSDAEVRLYKKTQRFLSVREITQGKGM